MKYIAWFIGTIVVLTVLSFGIKVLFFPVKTAENLVKTAYDAQDKVVNADNAIYNYEWFKQKFQDIEAAKKQRDNAIRTFNSFEDSLPNKRTEWTFEDKTEDARLRAVWLGLDNNLESLIADYNARASMATRNIFEDSVLPSYIDALTFITK